MRGRVSRNTWGLALRSLTTKYNRNFAQLGLLNDLYKNSAYPPILVTSRRHLHSSSSIHENKERECTNELDMKHVDTNIVTLTFNRPNAANAMGRTMLSQLQDAVSFLSSEEGKTVRCVILTSCSPTVFSAGADLRERSKMSMEEAAAFVTELRSTLDDITSLPMPLIACIEV